MSNNPYIDAMNAAIQNGLESNDKRAQANQAARLKAGGDESRIKQALALRDKFGPEANINVEGVSIGAKDPLSALLRKQAMDNAQQEHTEKDVQHLSGMLQKTGLPEVGAQLQSLEDATQGPGGGMVTNPEYKPKSANTLSRLLNKIPLAGGALASGGEQLGLIPKGAQSERQALQALMNTSIKNISGGAVSGGEQIRNDISLGASGDADAAKRGLMSLKNTAQAQQQNILASSRPDAVKLYNDRGGNTNFVPTAAPAPQAQPPKGMSFQQFKEWKRKSAGK